MNIVQYPNEILRSTTEIVYHDDISLEILDMMAQAMYSRNGVGLAAPQIGIKKSFFVFDPTAGEKSGSLEVAINPEILEFSPETQMCIEGCLSFPGVTETVKRPYSVLAKYTTASGKEITRRFEGFSSVVFQHELDHLTGKLFIDHISSLKRKLLLKDYTKGLK